MENVMTNGFTELSENEMYGVDGGGTIDKVIDKIDPLGWGQFIYDVSYNFGRDCYTFGREIYHFYENFKTNFFED